MPAERKPQRIIVNYKSGIQMAFEGTITVKYSQAGLTEIEYNTEMKRGQQGPLYLGTLDTIESIWQEALN